MHIDQSVLSVAQNPFAVITIIAAPAILTNASSILGLSTGNRLMKCLDTINTIEKKMNEGALPSLLEIYSEQNQLAYRQSRNFLRALRASYTSLGAFAFSCFLALLGSALMLVISVNFIEPLAILSLFVGGVGVLSLVWSSVELVIASRITVKIMEKNIQILKINKEIIL